MIKVDKKILCENCFAQTGREPCPECGFDRRTYICDPMVLRPGSILAGRYAIGRVIGKGGFGVTYLAYDLKLGCRVAVKEYYPYGIAARVPGSTQVSVSEAKETFRSGAEKFYDEARLVAQFNGNPNIVSVHDFFYENNTVYFTMGYLDGQTLKDYLKEHGALTPGQAVYVADAVSNALTAAHSRNVLHRDISPDNIMICRDGSIKLLDFGAARQVLTEGSQSLSVILKQGFAPLEQYQKKGKQGPWTDIYSLGATLYHALTLDTLDDPMSRLEDDRAYEANNYMIEEGLWQVIKKATELKGVDRYQDVFELRRDLGSLSIELLSLIDTGETDGKIQYGTTARAFDGTMRSVSAGIPDSTTVNSVPVQEEDVGVTRPLQEEGDEETQLQLEKDVEKSRSESHKSKMWKVWFGIVTAVFVGIFIIIAGGRKGPVVESLGTSNANLLNGGKTATFSDEYKYYIAGEDNALYVCDYDWENRTFHIDEGRKICNNVSYITLGRQKVYFLSTIDGVEAVCQMNKYGNDIHTLLYAKTEAQSLQLLQYAVFSDRREYLYFLMSDEADGEIKNNLYRYNLENGETELVIEGVILWYNLYDDSIYYTELTEDINLVVLSKAGLDGEDKQILNSDKKFVYGFAANDILYLVSSENNALLACNLDGTEKSGYGALSQLEIYMGTTFGYGEGWIYYTGNDGNIHKVSENGNKDTILLKGGVGAVLTICFDQSEVWFSSIQHTEKQHQCKYQVYYVNKDGSVLLVEADYSWTLPIAEEQDFQYEDCDSGIIITGYTGKLTSFEIPEKIDGKQVYSIGASAFGSFDGQAGSPVEEIGLPEGLQNIGEYAFCGCRSLKFIGLPEGLEDIDGAAFWGCDKLTAVDLPESLLNIDNQAFCGTALSKVYIPENVKSIGDGAFAVISDAGLTEITVSSNNKYFEVYGGALYLKNFYGDYDNRIPGPWALIAVPSGCSGCFTVANGTEHIGGCAFEHCEGLTEVIIPESVKSIGRDAFYGATLSEITVSRECRLPSDLGSDLKINYY